jgi:hypothetical protein
MMSKKLFFISMMAAVMLLMIGCGFNFNVGDLGVTRGSGKMASEERQVSGFSRVQLNGIGELIITQGDQESLTIEAEDNILPRLISEVRGDTLVIGFEEDSWQNSVVPSEGIKFTLQVKDLNGLEINGAATTNLGSLQTSELDIQINGIGDIRIDSLAADTLAVTISGGGNCDIKGTASNLEIKINGAGSLDAADLESSIASVKIAGAGDVTLWASDSIDIDISGTGNVDYYGEPSVTQNISGAGSITSLGQK